MARNITVTSARDTIAAPATAPGAAAIAIVRVSGPACPAIARLVLSRDLNEHAPGTLMLGRLLDGDGSAIDQCLAARWEAPSSYTGEDMLELHLHGSPALVSEAMNAVCRAGARPAAPGEFTRRAFANGKLDLAQAEAVFALTSAQTAQAGRAALSQLSGGLSARLGELRAQLLDVLSELEAMADYPEEGLPTADRDRLMGGLTSVVQSLAALVESAARGRRLMEGARLVFAGPPNAGKSSLFNAILRRERAIVTPQAGTTRDVIEAVVDLGGVPLTLVDTAGLRDAPEVIEALGVQRTREEIASADLVAFVVDVGAPIDEALEEYARLGDREHLLVLNKADLVGTDDLAAVGERFASPAQVGRLAVSVTRAAGIADFESAVAQWLGAGRGESAELVTGKRYAAELAAARTAAEAAAAALQRGGSPEFPAADLQEAVSHLDVITGQSGVDEEVLDLIFSKFCLGK